MGQTHSSSVRPLCKFVLEENENTHLLASRLTFRIYRMRKSVLITILQSSTSPYRLSSTILDISSILVLSQFIFGLPSRSIDILYLSNPQLTLLFPLSTVSTPEERRLTHASSSSPALLLPFSPLSPLARPVPPCYQL